MPEVLSPSPHTRLAAPLQIGVSSSHRSATSQIPSQRRQAGRSAPTSEHFQEGTPEPAGAEVTKAGILPRWH